MSNKSNRELLTARLRLAPFVASDFDVFVEDLALGESLLSQQKYVQSELYVLESLEILTVSQRTENNRLTLARQRLDRLQAKQ